MSEKPTVLVDGFAFTECPRWHNGKLWFSDVHGCKVMTVDLEGNSELKAELPTRPSGLGWLPDGRLQVVSIMTSQLLRLDSDGFTVVADLSNQAAMCSDMEMDSQGRAYVGSFSYLLNDARLDAPAWIIMVNPDGSSQIVAEGIAFPNGTIITPDEKTLVIAESLGKQLSAFDIESDGSLTRRRVWAEFETCFPDGICLDVEGAIWIASPFTSEVIRVREGGEILQTIKTDLRPFACMLGGPNMRTLFIMEAETFNHEEALEKMSGRITTIDVEIPGP